MAGLNNGDQTQVMQWEGEVAIPAGRGPTGTQNVITAVVCVHNFERISFRINNFSLL